MQRPWPFRTRGHPLCLDFAVHDHIQGQKHACCLHVPPLIKRWVHSKLHGDQHRNLFKLSSHTNACCLETQPTNHYPQLDRKGQFAFYFLLRFTLASVSPSASGLSPLTFGLALAGRAEREHLSESTRSVINTGQYQGCNKPVVCLDVAFSQQQVMFWLSVFSLPWGCKARILRNTDSIDSAMGN